VNGQPIRSAFTITAAHVHVALHIVKGETTTEPHVWLAHTVDDPSAWHHSLSERFLGALDETVLGLRKQPRQRTELSAALEPCAARAEELKPVLAALESGRGFAIVRGLPLERFSRAEVQVCYWLISQLLGQPVEQNVQGTLLYDVCDTGQNVRQGARFSVTNAESTFHTDNSFGLDVVDYVGLLCLRPAKRGGLSQMVSGYSAYHELLARHAEVLEVLTQPMHIERRGGVLPGESPTVQQPVLTRNERGLILRYLRYWIESGHEKIDQPLTAAQRQALDTLDAVLNDPALRVEFVLEPGDMYFINNRWILHNRTAFEDYEDPDQRRHLVRIWLKSRR
jgi:hypothetical protein